MKNRISMLGLALVAMAVCAFAPSFAGEECYYGEGQCFGGCGETDLQCMPIGPQDCGCEIVMFVDLESFTAEAVPEGVMLRWTTSTESDNMGFRLLRLRRNVGKIGPAGVELQVVAPELILPMGNGLYGASYEYLDRSRHGAGSVYFLEDVDVRGRATVHGPAFVERGRNARTRR